METKLETTLSSNLITLYKAKFLNNASGADELKDRILSVVTSLSNLFIDEFPELPDKIANIVNIKATITEKDSIDDVITRVSDILIKEFPGLDKKLDEINGKATIPVEGNYERVNVVTLSSFLTVRPITSKNPWDDLAIYDFTKLYQYHKSCFSYCPKVLPNTVTNYTMAAYSSFFKIADPLKVAYMFWNYQYTAIHQYKIGELKPKSDKKNEEQKTRTELFTDILLEHFPFLATHKLIPQDIKDELWQHKSEIIAIKDLNDKDQLTDVKVAEALLQYQFSKQVHYAPDAVQMLKKLFSKNEPVIFECDSNPIIAYSLISQLTELFKNIKWNPDAMLDEEDNRPSVKTLAPNIFLASSFNFGTYSSHYNNNKFNVKKPTITERLVLANGADKLRFISHFPLNREEANDLGVPTKTPGEFLDLKQEVSEKKTV